MEKFSWNKMKKVVATMLAFCMTFVAVQFIAPQKAEAANSTNSVVARNQDAQIGVIPVSSNTFVWKSTLSIDVAAADTGSRAQIMLFPASIYEGVYGASFASDPGATKAQTGFNGDGRRYLWDGANDRLAPLALFFHSGNNNMWFSNGDSTTALNGNTSWRGALDGDVADKGKANFFLTVTVNTSTKAFSYTLVTEDGTNVANRSGSIPTTWPVGEAPKYVSLVTTNANFGMELRNYYRDASQTAPAITLATTDAKFTNQVAGTKWTADLAITNFVAQHHDHETVVTPTYVSGFGGSALPADFSVVRKYNASGVNTDMQVVWDNPTEGTHVFKLGAKAGTGGTDAEVTYTLVVAAPLPDAPVITTSVLAGAIDGVSYTHDIEGTDFPTGTDFDYTLLVEDGTDNFVAFSSHTDAATVFAVEPTITADTDEAAEFEWTAPVEGTYKFRLVITNTSGATAVNSVAKDITMTVAAAGELTWTTPESFAWKSELGEAFTPVAIEATSGEAGEVVSYDVDTTGATNAPSNIDISGTTVVWPDAASATAGTYDFKLVASSSEVSVPDLITPVTIDVYEYLALEEVTTMPAAMLNGDFEGFTVVATGGKTATTTFSMAAAGPGSTTGLVIDSDTGVVTWPAAARTAGAYTVTVTATNGTDTATKAYTFNVIAFEPYALNKWVEVDGPRLGGSPMSPTINSSNIYTGSVITIEEVSGGTSQAILDDFITVAGTQGTNTGVGNARTRLEFDPTVAGLTVGFHQFNIVVTNGNATTGFASSTQKYTIGVTPAAPTATVAAGALPEESDYDDFTIDLGSDGTGASLAEAATAEEITDETYKAFPTGDVTIDTAGEITWANPVPGEYKFKVTLANRVPVASVTQGNGVASQAYVESKTELIYTLVITEYEAPAIEGTVAVTGDAEIGETLTATESITAPVAPAPEAPVTPAYQWQEKVADAWVDIASATAATYTILAADAGKELRVEVTGDTTSGAIYGTVAETVAYNIEIAAAFTDDDGDDDVTTVAPTAVRVGDEITIDFVLDDIETSNKLVLKIGSVIIATITDVAETDVDYTLTAADIATAVNGVITIDAVFSHLPLLTSALTYTPATDTLVFGDTLSQPVLTLELDSVPETDLSAVEYESSDEDVATVDENGVITLGTKVGVTTITATYPENATYAEGTATFTLTVDKADQDAPAITAIDEVFGGSGTGFLQGVSILMEYMLSSDSTYTAILAADLVDGNKIELAVGEYLVRLIETATANVGDDTTVEILAYVPAVVTSVAIATAPTLKYADGEALDLSGLVVSLGWSKTEPGQVTSVPFATLAANDLTVDVANGTTLALANDGDIITVTHGASGFTATMTLEVVEEFTVNFVDGATTVATRQVLNGDAVGTLPTMSNTSTQNFKGWFTAATAGTQIDGTEIVDDNVEFYAQWTAKSTSTPSPGGGTRPLPSSAPTPTPVATPTPAPTATPEPTPEPIEIVIVDENGEEIAANEDGNIVVPEGGATVELPGAIVEIEEGATISVNEDGSVTVEDGNATAQTDKGAEISLPNGSVISGDNTVIVGEDGATVNFDSGISLGIKGDSVIQIDESAPLGYVVVGATPFNDVKNSDWFSDAVQFAYSHNLFAGTGTNTFSPVTPMTRGMLVTVLYHLAGDPAIGAAADFADVADGAYYADAVAWAVENKVASGVGADMFAPSQNITREQLVTMLYGYAKKIGLAEAGSAAAFADADSISPWAAEAVAWAKASGVVAGRPGNIFDPKAPATRAEVAAILLSFVAMAK